LNVRIRYDALDRTTGEHVQGAGALVDIQPDNAHREGGWATFYVFRDDEEDGDEIEPVCLRGRLTYRRLLDGLAGEP
jgi:hypothetical protein